MVGAAAGGLGGAALRTTMVVGARIGAIRQFGLLSRTLGALNNRMVQTGLGVSTLVGEMKLLGGVMNALVNPFTGLFALLATAMSAKSAMDYSAGVRSVQLAWGLMGDEAGDIEEFFKNVEHYLSRDQATALFNNAEAVKTIAKMYGTGDEGMATMIMELAARLEDVKKVDFGAAVGAMAEAANGSEPALKRLAQMMGAGLDEHGGLTENADTAAEMFALMDETLRETDWDFTGPENYANAVDKLAERVHHIPDALSNLGANIAAELTKGLTSGTDSLLDIMNAGWSTGGATFEVIDQLSIGLGDVIMLGITGKFDEIPPYIMDVWWPNLKEAWGRWIGAQTLWLEGLGVDWLMNKFFGTEEFWKASWEDRGEMIVEGLVRGITNMFNDMTNVVSKLIAAFKLGIGPGFKQMWNYIARGAEMAFGHDEGFLPRFDESWMEPANVDPSTLPGANVNRFESNRGITQSPIFVMDGRQIATYMQDMYWDEQKHISMPVGGHGGDD